MSLLQSPVHVWVPDKSIPERHVPKCSTPGPLCNNSEGQGSEPPGLRRIGQENRQVGGEHWLCGEWWKNAFLSKLYSSMTVWVSDKSFSRNRTYQRSLLSAASRPFFRTWALQGGIMSSWRTGLVHPQTGAVWIQLLNPGRMTSEGSVG